MHKIIRKLSIGILTLSLLTPVINTFNVNQIYVNAKIRRHHNHKIRHNHNRYHRQQRKSRHYRHRQRSRKVSYRHQHKNRAKIKRLKGFSAQIKNQTLNDINNDRNNYGIPSVKETRQLDQLAQIRAKQLIYNFSHYDRQGRTLYEEEAKKLGISLTQHYHHNNTYGYHTASGENIANASLNHGLNYTTMPRDPKIYHNHNGYDMANMDNDAMMNYDSQSNWGHRRNLLNRQFKKVGIGVTRYHGTYFLAEDFDS